MSSLDIKRGMALGRPRLLTIPVVGTATGPILTLRRLLGSGSTLALIAGTNANLTLSGATISATAALGNATQVAVVRESRGILAVEYSITFAGVVAAVATIAFGTPSVSAEEGNVAIFPLVATRNGVTGDLVGTWVVEPDTTHANPANAADFPGGVFPGGTATIAAGGSSGSIAVATAEDSAVEPNEGYIVKFTFGGVTVTSKGTIVDDDSVVAPAPTTMQSSVSDVGPTGNTITYTFASAVPVGRFAAGDAFAIDPVVTAISPAGATIAAGVGTFGPEGVTFTDSTNVVNQNGHGLVNGDQVAFDSITGTTGIAINTKYFVVGVIVPASGVTGTPNTFQLATTAGGAPIDLVTNGSGVMRRYYMQDRDVNGAAVNPRPQSASGGAAGTGANPALTFQGFDTLVYSRATKPTEFPYSAALNLDPGKTGQPISGTGKMIVKAMSVVFNMERDGRNRVSDLSTLTLLDRAPPAGSFRRWSGAPSKTPLFTTADIDWTGYPSFPQPANSILPSKSDILKTLGPANMYAGTQDLFSRGTRPLNMQADYGGFFARDLVQAILYTMTAGVAVADRNEVVFKVAQIGLDVFDALETGVRWSSPAFSFGGAHQWVKLVVMYAGWLFRNASNTVASAALSAYTDGTAYRIFADDMMAVQVTRAMIETRPKVESITSRINPTGYEHHDENLIDWMSKPSSDYVSFSMETAYRQTNGYPLLGTALFARLLGREALWNNPAFFAYHDRLFMWWEKRGFPETEARLTSYMAAFFKAQWKAASPAFQGSAPPLVNRRVARDQYVWFECSEPLDHAPLLARPAPSDFAVTVDGAAVSLATVTIAGCSAVATNASTPVNTQFPTITVPNAAAAGVRVGMPVVVQGGGQLPHDCVVTAISGNSVTVSTYVLAPINNATLLFSPVFLRGNAFGVVLPTALTGTSQAVQIAYTPGANPIRNLRGAALPQQPLATVPNNTGRLPDAFTGTPAIVYGGADKGTRQWMGMDQPRPSGVIKRLFLSDQLMLQAYPATNENILASAAPTGTTFRLYAADTTQLRLFFGTNNTGGNVANTLRLPGSITDLIAAIPVGTRMTFHLAIDLTATTLATMFRGVFRGENNGTYVLGSGTGGYGTTAIPLDGSLSTTLEQMFTLGLFRGASGSGNDAIDAAFGKFLLGYGGADLPLPSSLTGAQFAHGADWGTNGRDLWGIVPQFYFPFSLDDANSKIINRGSGGSASMTPRRVLDAETGELTSAFVAV